MPLLVGGASYRELATTLDGSELWWIKSQSPGNIAATWIDPDGNLFPLTQPWADSGPGYFTTFGPAAWGATPIELVTDPYPRGGEVVRYIRAAPRRIQWPLYVGGDSHMAFVENYRTIMKAFTKTTYRRAAGTLEIARPDGSKRRIAAFYEQGFEGEAGENWLWANPTVQLFCPDGYFYDPNVVPVPFTVPNVPDPAPTTNFFTPFMTIEAGRLVDDSGEQAGKVITNPGDVDAWPVWTITGPINGFTATNVTTGLRFACTANVPDGVTLTINTNPPAVRTSTGLNWSSYIDWFNPDGTQLWPLAAGDNTVTVVATNALADTEDSSVLIKFQPRYETA